MDHVGRGARPRELSERAVGGGAAQVDVRMLLEQTVVGSWLSDTAGVFLARPGHRRLPQQPPTRRMRPVPGGLGAAIGFGAGVLSTCAGALLGARDAPVIGLVLLGGTVAAVAAVTTFAGVVAAAVQCWGLWSTVWANSGSIVAAGRGWWRWWDVLRPCVSLRA